MYDMREALRVVRANADGYVKALQWVFEHRGELREQVFFTAPTGAEANKSPWKEIVAGSEAKCECGTFRLLIPTVQRRDLIPTGTTLTLRDGGKRQYIKPIGAAREATFVSIWVENELLVWFEDPFGPIIFRPALLVGADSGYKLSDLERSLSSRPVPVRFRGIPAFRLDSVDSAAGTVTITLDVAVEAFDPDSYQEHKH